MNEISENQADLNSSLLPVGVDLAAIGVQIFWYPIKIACRLSKNEEISAQKWCE